MLKLQGGPESNPAVAGQMKKLLLAGFAILVGIALLGIGVYFSLHRGSKASEKMPAQPPVAELISASGMILVQTPGNPEWREVKTGARFSEGDLVRTDSAGDAGIQYKNGTVVTIPRNTVMTVRKSAGNEMEIAVSPDATMPPLLLSDEKGNPKSGKGPFIELHQIIPFGKSLELIGRVETGSSLLINGEIADVTAEGQFKHFTKPFPSSVDIVHLNLKVTDLAGRTHTYTAIHDFRTYGGAN